MAFLGQTESIWLVLKWIVNKLSTDYTFLSLYMYCDCIIYSLAEAE